MSCALYGALAGEEQDRAIAPARPGRRKIVLATSIAETSITIEGVRIVVDAGLARVPRYEPDVGVTRLETVRVSRAAADQRRGRAGRTEPGVCYRLWDEPQTAALEPFARPEILAADLSSFALDLAAWGSRPGQARVPRSAAAAGARRGEVRSLPSSAPSTATAASPTRAGTCGGCRCRRGLPAWWSMPAPRAKRCSPPRSPPSIGERGLGGDDVDLRERLAALRRDRSRRGARRPRHGGALGGRSRASAFSSPEAGRMHSVRKGEDGTMSIGALLALAYPERIAKNRGGGAGRHFCWPTAAAPQSIAASPLAREPFLAVAELAGSAAQGRILLRRADRARRDRGALCRPHRSARGHHVRCREHEFARAQQPPARRHRACGRSRCRSRRAKRPRHCSPTALRKHRDRPAAVDQSAQAMARPRHVPARQRRRRVARSVRRGAGARPRANGSRRRSQGRPRLPKSRRDELEQRFARAPALGAASAGSMPRRRPISRRRPARACRSITRPRAARKSRSGCRNCSGSTAIRRSPAARFRSRSNCSRRRIGRCR